MSAARDAISRIPSSLSFHDDVKPYIEVVHGRRRRKMSPKLIHGQLQWRLAAWLDAWGRERGEVATEWRCYLLDAEKKITLYFAHGCRLLVLVYPEQREIVFSTPSAQAIRRPAQGRLSVPGYPDLTLDNDALFENTQPEGQ